MPETEFLQNFLSSAAALDETFDFWIKHLEKLSGNKGDWIDDTRRCYLKDGENQAHVYDFYNPDEEGIDDCFVVINVLQAINPNLGRGVSVGQIPYVKDLVIAQYGQISGNISVEEYKSNSFSGDIEMLTLSACIEQISFEKIDIVLSDWVNGGARNDLINHARQIGVEIHDGNDNGLGLFGGMYFD